MDPEEYADPNPKHCIQDRLHSIIAQEGKPASRDIYSGILSKLKNREEFEGLKKLVGI